MLTGPLPGCASRVARLRWTDVDFVLHRIHVRRSVVASGRRRLRSRARSIVGAGGRGSRHARRAQPARVVHRSGDLVFCNQLGEHLSDGMLRRRFYAALDVGAPRVRLHDLRHGFGRSPQAFPITDVQGYLGHAHISTTMRYIHHTPGDEDAARLQAVLSRDVSPTVSPTAAFDRNSAQLSASDAP